MNDSIESDKLTLDDLFREISLQLNSYRVYLYILLTGLICLTLRTAAAAVSSESKHAANDNKAEAKSRWSEIEKSRKELQAKLRQARQKEQIAYMQLNRIKSKLNVANDALNKSKNKLHKTENRINECETIITQTRSKEEILTDSAVKRLREIYEGQRLSLLEMLFQVSSLQSLLDLFYFQERIAEMDKKLLEELKAKAVQLTAKKSQLGSQRNKLGDLVSEIAKLASLLNKEKLNQEQVAERLRTQRAFYEQAERQLAAESLQLEHQILDFEKHGTKNMQQGSGRLALPLHASITSPFGWRRHPIFGVRKFHTGIDLAGPNHSQINSADSGSVLYSGWYGGYGKVVIVSHGNGMATLYAHLSKINVRTGQNVNKGDVLGYEGTTGFSTGPHLHFEVRINGKPNNPLNFVRAQ